jgi:hypothetical protein
MRQILSAVRLSGCLRCFDYEFGWRSAAVARLTRMRLVVGFSVDGWPMSVTGVPAVSALPQHAYPAALCRAAAAPGGAVTGKWL